MLKVLRLLFEGYENKGIAGIMLICQEKENFE